MLTAWLSPCPLFPDLLLQPPVGTIPIVCRIRVHLLSPLESLALICRPLLLPISPGGRFSKHGNLVKHSDSLTFWQIAFLQILQVSGHEHLDWARGRFAELWRTGRIGVGKSSYNVLDTFAA